MNKKHNEAREVLRTNKMCPKCGAELHVVAIYTPIVSEVRLCGFMDCYELCYQVKCSNSKCDIQSDLFFRSSEIEDAWRLKILDE